MDRPRFIPDRFDRAVMARGWVVLAGLLAQASVMLAGAGDAATPFAARRLLRIGEALARRLLAARAMLSPLPVIRPLSRKARAHLASLARRRRLDPRDVRYVPPPEKVWRFQLAEPLARFSALEGGAPDTPIRARKLVPARRVATYGILTVRTWSTHGDPFAEPVNADGAPVAPKSPPTVSLEALARRLAALQDVTERPAAHARRMARWIARQRAMHHGRTGPMRPGKAPGQVAPRARTDAHNALSEASTVAHRALWSQRPLRPPGPPNSGPPPQAQGPPG